MSGCSTSPAAQAIVPRLAAERVRNAGRIAGADVNASMLEVAWSTTPAGVSIEWHQSNAESLPHADGSFDVVLCRMGLQTAIGRR